MNRKTDSPDAHTASSDYFQRGYDAILAGAEWRLSASPFNGWQGERWKAGAWAAMQFIRDANPSAALAEAERLEKSICTCGGCPSTTAESRAVRRLAVTR